MDGFSYNNIFETKGIEYLIIITFLLLIIPFWILINRKPGALRQTGNTVGVLSANILKVPLGLLYSRNHIWAHLEKSGKATIGADDFLLHVTGLVKIVFLKDPGDEIMKGDLIAEIVQNNKLLKIFSPLSGKILNSNPLLTESGEVINVDPYGRGWIYMIKPSQWITETSTCLMADEAIAWSKRELERFKDFMAASSKKYSPESTMLALQDGGELIDKPLSGLPDEIWQDFQKTFLN